MTTEKDNIIIQLSKGKLILITIGSFAFVATGIFLMLRPAKFLSPAEQSEWSIFIVGLAAVLFFSLTGVYSFLKLFDQRPGLIISKHGFLDNSSGVAAGLVLWSDVAAIEIGKEKSQRFILVVVRNPETYLQRQPSRIKRMAMELNHRLYGTPICLSANGLKISFDELHKIFAERVREDQTN